MSSVHQPRSVSSASVVRVGPRVVRQIAACAVVLTGCATGPAEADTKATDATATGENTSEGSTHDATGEASSETIGATSGTSALPETDSESGGSSTGTAVPPTCGPLAQIPSEPGPHVASIEALGDEEWLALGSPAPDPEFGTAMGRSWGGQAFAPAPALRGAFFTGEGVHAYVKPDGYGMDDVWFYDVNAHAWVAIYPGNHIASFNERVTSGELSIDRNGQLQDVNGDPVPLHVLIHAWDFLAYDTATNRFAFVAGDGMNGYFMPGLETIQPGLDALHAQRERVDIATMSPWFYSVEDCTWERYPVATADPFDGSLFSAFIYSETDARYLYVGQAGAAVFDPTIKDWSIEADTGPRPTGYDSGAVYDSLRNRVYMGQGSGGSGGLHVYDIDTAQWSQPASRGLAPEAFGTNFASTMYDTVNDVLTIFHYADGTRYTWDPKTETWTNAPIPVEVLTAVGYPSFNAFYDPKVNAYFVFVATDSVDNGTMWAYRYGQR